MRGWTRHERETTMKTKTYGECGCCGKRIDLATARQAVLGTDGNWYEVGGIGEDDTQGEFDVGRACFAFHVKKSERNYGA